MDSKKFNDKVSLITGASSGIGRSTAVYFSSLGSKLVLMGRNEVNLDETIALCVEANGAVEILKIVGDVTDDAALKSAVDGCIGKFGKLNHLINNAGMGIGAGLINMTMEDYDAVMNTNVRAVIKLTQLCAPHLIETRGSVVNVSSLAGTCSLKNMLAYCMSKSALDQFTKCVALELAEKGVRVNAVNPAAIETPIFKEHVKVVVESCKHYPIGRIGQPEEVARTIGFLASDDASFITGELVHISGGQHINIATVKKD